MNRIVTFAKILGTCVMITVILIYAYIKYMPLYTEFTDNFMPSNYQCIRCEGIDFSETENGFKLIKPIGQSVNYVWSKEIAYDLTKTSAIKVDFDTYATGDLSENIIMFSRNRASWGENSDALTLGGRTNGTDIWNAGIRTGMFANWLASKDWNNSKQLVRPDKWSHVTVSLNQTNTCMFVDEKEMICSALSAGQIPLQGHIGFWAWSSNTGGVLEVKNIKIVPLSASEALNPGFKEVTGNQETQKLTAVNSAENNANHHSNSSTTVGIDIYHAPAWKGLAEEVTQSGFKMLPLDYQIDEQSLQSLNILILADGRPNKSFSGSEVHAITEFVRNGGRLLCVGQAWSWVYKEYDNKPIETYPLNQLGKALNFWITGENIGAPKYLFSPIMADVKELKRIGWWPSRIELNDRNSIPIVRDENMRIMAGAVPFGKGMVVIYGHSGLLEENPNVLHNTLIYLSNSSLSTSAEQSQTAKELSENPNASNEFAQPEPEKKKIEIQWSKNVTAKDNKEAEFLKLFKPRPICEDPNIDWGEFVKCKNDKMSAREKFYKNH